MNAVYILFSGGYDSSYTVVNMLNSYEKKIEKPDIFLISVNATFLLHKAEREKKARETMISYWKKRYPNINIISQELLIDIKDLHVVSAYGLTQPLFWIPSLMMCVDMKKYDNISIVFSYICGDQALSYKEEIETICRCVGKIMYVNDNIVLFDKDSSNDRIFVKFPNLVTYKEKIIEDLISKDQYIFETCTTCENVDEDDFCGRCVPCRNLKACFNNILSDNDVSDNVKKQ